MRGSSGNRKMKKEKDKSEDEVEQLLQAAQDQILLKLSLNSHIADRAPPPSSKKGPNHNDDDINLDLERRFQALKTKSPATSTQHRNDQELRSVLGDDLSARFAALKAKSSSSTTTNIELGPAATAASSVPSYEEESEDEEEQVHKLIEWAKDAARLDPSPPSDEDDGDDDNQDSSASDQDNHTPRKRK